MSAPSSPTHTDRTFVFVYIHKRATTESILLISVVYVCFTRLSDSDFLFLFHLQDFMVVIVTGFVSKVTFIYLGNINKQFFPREAKISLCIKLPDQLSSCHHPFFFFGFSVYSGYLIFQIRSGILEQDNVFFFSSQIFHVLVQQAFIEKVKLNLSDTGFHLTKFLRKVTQALRSFAQTMDFLPEFIQLYTSPFQ